MRTLVWLLVAILSGCAGTAKPARTDGSGATLRFNVSSNSTGTRARSWRIASYKDSTCTAKDTGRTLTRKAFAELQDSLGPVIVEPGVPATIGMLYLEARYGENRECSYTFNLTPKLGETYSVDFHVSQESSVCGATVRDSADRVVSVDAPEYSCSVGMMPKRLKNGRSGVTHYKIGTSY